MDWFEALMGFKEAGYEATRRQLEVNGDQLRSLANGRSYGIGRLELVSLQTLRKRVAELTANEKQEDPQEYLRCSIVQGEARSLHDDPRFEGALFQVASQFNLLEMTGPSVTPEHGVTRYAQDHTQGPACAMAAGPATIYRNYLAPVHGRVGQTATRQIDALADLGAALAEAVGLPVDRLWNMRNGYAMFTVPGLTAIDNHLATCTEHDRWLLMGHLQIGMHWRVEVPHVNEDEQDEGPFVSQAFCSALPVSYNQQIPSPLWSRFASLVLEAAYEATLWAAVINADEYESRAVLLTRLGGGAFGNDDEWIHSAMKRALGMASTFDLQVGLVSFGAPSKALIEMAAECNRRGTLGEVLQL